MRWWHRMLWATPWTAVAAGAVGTQFGHWWVIAPATLTYIAAVAVLVRVEYFPPRVEP